MFRSDVYGAVPGFTAASETYENAFRWGREGLGLIVGGQISGAARDPTNTPTTVLRPGLLMSQIAASGLLTAYDGTSPVYGALLSSFRMQDLDGSNINRFVWLLVGGPVQAARLIGLDEGARASMANRFIFDDRGFQASGSPGSSMPQAKTTAYTVVNGTDNGALFTNKGATGTVVFTLPTTLQAGQRWRFYAEAGFTITITAPAGKLVTFNNAAATSISFSTASEIIGGSVEIVVNSDATKYLAISNIATEAQTPVIA